jgi:hypothetical protein
MTTSAADPTPPPLPRPGLLARASHWAPVRLVVYAVALVVAVVAFTLLTNPLIPPAPSPQNHTGLLVRNLVSSLILLALYVVMVRLVERRGAGELDPRRGAPLLAAGAAVGVLLMGVVYLVLWALGRATLGPGTGLASLGPGLVLAFSVAVFEELLFRAVLFRILEEAGGASVAVIVSAAMFGLLHALNPGATPLSTLAIALEAGVLLAVAYAASRNLWLPIGIHMGWNFTEGSIFGAAVSGGTQPSTLATSTLSGPRWLTGGAFGPEASVVSIVVCLAAAGALAAMILRRHGWRPAVLRLRLA